MTVVRTAAIFPGQGSQAVGMGRELADAFPCARALFDEADALVGFPLAARCFDGPADDLKRTAIAQPALLTVSIAYWRVLTETQAFTCDAVAGHSLGEYSALVAAGALTFAEAVRLVALRGQLMDDAATRTPGGMAAVLELPDAEVVALCEELSAQHGLLAPANFNAPGQVVVSGASEAVAAVRGAARARGGKAIPLPVSGPFHSALMAPAAEAFARALDAATITRPSVPVVPNVTGVPTQDPAAIREALRRQITGAVRWTAAMSALSDMGIARLVEVGPGKVLTGLAQRCLPAAEALPVNALLTIVV